MTHRKRLSRILLASSIAALAGLAACEKKAAPKPQASAPSSGMSFEGGGPPPAPAFSLADLKLHPKVQFPEDRLPSTPEMAKAIGALASAIAAGSADELQAMITPRDRMVLDMLVKSGEWKRQSDALKVVRVCVVNEQKDGVFQVGLGLEDSEGAFLQGWEAAGQIGSWTMTNMPIEPRLASAAPGLDGAELALMALPVGVKAEEKPLLPDNTDKAKPEDDKEKKPKPKKDPPGLLRRERF